MLSTTAKHALRALVRLARLPEGRIMPGRDLAQTAQIPANYLSKILCTLGSAGIIDATRGTGGGYRLQRRPENIPLAEVVELFDRPRLAHRCLLDSDRPCSDEMACGAHKPWSAVKEVYLEFLHTTTLASLAAGDAASRPLSPRDGSAHPRARSRPTPRRASAVPKHKPRSRDKA